MAAVMIATAVAIWCAYRIADAGKGKIISERPATKLDPMQHQPLKADPRLAHTAWCKCYSCR